MPYYMCLTYTNEEVVKGGTSMTLKLNPEDENDIKDTVFLMGSKAIKMIEGDEIYVPMLKVETKEELLAAVNRVVEAKEKKND